MPHISILTPTYNRATLLPGVFRSLQRQTCKDFEWIVVDDGSTDNTAAVVSGLHPDTFDIRYFHKENGGKHTAVNYGVREARGSLTLILDSDDVLPPTAVATILQMGAAAEERDHATKPIGGVCGYMAHRGGLIIGQPMISKVCDEFALRYHYGVHGDMCEVFLTKVLREFPFPEIEGEKFCPELLVWNRIAAKYALRVFPKVIYYRDYLDGGLTDNIVRVRMQSAVASCMTYAEQLSYDIPFLAKVRAAMNYWRFRLCVRKGKEVPGLSAAWLWAAPLGWIMHLRDIFKLKTGDESAAGHNVIANRWG